ncbi:MAG: pyridoxal-phosphate dependent enzyme [Spirochaetia bacterium]
MRIRYACVTCSSAFESEEIVYECPSCAAQVNKDGRAEGFSRGYLTVEWSPAAPFAPGSPVDPLQFMPFPIRDFPSYPAGGTPLVSPAILRKKTGFPHLSFKNDTLNPSGSLKDRASLLVAAQAWVHGEKRVALASTGNAGASMAGAGAAFGLEVVLFVPGAAPRAKLLQSLLYGARVVPVKGTYDDAFSLSMAYTAEYGGINRNTAYNPFTVEGKKTVSLELYNQLGCRVPDVVYVPTGDGVIFSGACKGFADLVKAGCTDRMPVMVAVQAEGSNALARSWREAREIILPRTSTIADSLSVCKPASGHMALDYLRRTRGRTVEVSDAEITAAQAELAREAGVFVEPSSAAAWAGFMKDRHQVDPGSRVVVLLTGTGFKDIGAAEKLVTLPTACDASLEAAARLLADVYGLRTRT